MGQYLYVELEFRHLWFSWQTLSLLSFQKVHNMQLRAFISLFCLLAALVASAPSAEILEDRGLPEVEEGVQQGRGPFPGLSKTVSPEATLGQPQEAFDAETDSIVPEQEEVLAEVGSVAEVETGWLGRRRRRWSSWFGR